MSSIEETAYPRLLDDVVQQEIEQLYTPTPKERAFVNAHQALRRPISRACAMLQLKLMQRLGYSVPLAGVPLAITAHVCRKLKVPRPTLRKPPCYAKAKAKTPCVATAQRCVIGPPGSLSDIVGRSPSPFLRQPLSSSSWTTPGEWMQMANSLASCPQPSTRRWSLGGYKAKLGEISLNTLIHRIAVLSKVHQVQNAANPCEQSRVRELLSKTRRGYAKRGALPQKKPALTREPLEALLETCDDSLTGLRDRALLLFAFSSGGRRRSEVCAATVENTRREGHDFIFTLSHSKTNQAGFDRPENDKPIVGKAAQALFSWLHASQIRSGPIFRRVRRGNKIGEPLSPSAVRDIVKKRCASAGIEGAFSAHSLRSGFVTEAGRQGMPLGETMAMTGHRSAASLVGYFRHGVHASSVARLLED